MNPKSAEALVGIAILTGFLGVVVMNPSARFVMLASAAVMALIPAIACKGKILRIVALVVSMLTIAGAAASYSEHEIFSAKYQKHVQERAAKAKATPPPPAQKQ